MNLPAGIQNRPPSSAPHPAVLGRVLRLVLLVAFLLAPLLATAAIQVKGIYWRYECAEIERDLATELRRHQELLAERSRLTSPARLRREGEWLGLVPGNMAAGQTIIVRDAVTPAGGDR